MMISEKSIIVKINKSMIIIYCYFNYRNVIIKTNLFNLTYKITDEEGNNILVYSLKEVQTKLNGLKNWLRKNVVPVNSNVRDITGLAYSPGTIWRKFDPCVNITKNITKNINSIFDIKPYLCLKNVNSPKNIKMP